MRAETAAPVRVLTPARRRALEVLAERGAKGRLVRVSNTTDGEHGLVYWQSAAWLCKAGLAEGVASNGRPSSIYLRITDAGRDVLGGGA